MNKKLKELQNTKERIKFAENAIESSQLKIQKEKESIEYFKKEVMELLIEKEKLEKKLGKIL